MDNSRAIFSMIGLVTIMILTAWTHNDGYKTLEQAITAQSEMRAIAAH